MGILEVLGVIFGSSATSIVLTALVNRKKTNAEINETYSDRLEKRVKTLETRLDAYEMKCNIQMVAINSAYTCKAAEGDNWCPVLKHMELNPAPQPYVTEDNN